MSTYQYKEEGSYVARLEVSNDLCGNFIERNINVFSGSTIGITASPYEEIVVHEIYNSKPLVSNPLNEVYIVTIYNLSGQKILEFTNTNQSSLVVSIDNLSLVFMCLM
jgi:hypothetical protein